MNCGLSYNEEIQDYIYSQTTCTGDKGNKNNDHPTPVSCVFGAPSPPIRHDPYDPGGWTWPLAGPTKENGPEDVSKKLVSFLSTDATAAAQNLKLSRSPRVV